MKIEVKVDGSGFALVEVVAENEREGVRLEEFLRRCQRHPEVIYASLGRPQGGGKQTLTFMCKVERRW